MTCEGPQRQSMTVPAQGKVCRFCGLSTDVPHETQQACIGALHAEIARMKELLEHIKLPAVESEQRHISNTDPKLS